MKEISLKHIVATLWIGFILTFQINLKAQSAPKQDSLSTKKDSTTLPKPKKKSLESIVTFKAHDSMSLNFTSKKVNLYNSAEILSSNKKQQFSRFYFNTKTSLNIFIRKYMYIKLYCSF